MTGRIQLILRAGQTANLPHDTAIHERAKLAQTLGAQLTASVAQTRRSVPAHWLGSACGKMEVSRPTAGACIFDNAGLVWWYPERNTCLLARAQRGIAT
jgi:hypothetical protein